MATPKYITIFNEMVQANEELFKKLQDPKTKKSELDDIRMEALRVARKAENKLCARSESTKFGKFSSQLADMFWKEIRQQYPNIDDSVTIKY